MPPGAMQVPTSQTTIAGSDACHLCRRRRTVSSAARQSIACQSRDSSSGPFTTPRALTDIAAGPFVMASNLPFGSGVVVIGSAQAHLTRVSTLSGPGTQPVSGQLSGTTGGGPIITSRFPAAFRLPAFASRVIRFPPGTSAFLTVGLPDPSPGLDPVGVTTFRAYELRPGWVPSVPRGRRCSPGRQKSPAGACRFPAASPYTPLTRPIGGAHV
jgi:hypothetical protein